MREYEISKAGHQQSATYATTYAAVLELIDWTSGSPFKKASFAIQSTSKIYLQQGSSDSASMDSAFPLPTGVFWRIDVDSPEERYLYVNGVTASGTVYVMRISDMVDAFGTFTNGS